MQAGARRRSGLAVAGLLLGAALSGCGGGDAGDPTAGSTSADRGDDPNRLQVRTADSGTGFVPAELTARAGQVFSIRFANTTDEEHAFALVEEGDEPVAEASPTGPQDKTVEPLPPGTPSPSPQEGEVLADSAGPVGPDSARLVQVRALPAGTYTYLCTVGDHAEQGMRGVLRVE